MNILSIIYLPQLLFRLLASTISFRAKRPYAHFLHLLISPKLATGSAGQPRRRNSLQAATLSINL